MTAATETTEVIEVPDGLDADEAAAFILNVIRARGGDPDTAHVLYAEVLEPSKTLALAPFKIDWGAQSDD